MIKGLHVQLCLFIVRDTNLEIDWCARALRWKKSVSPLRFASLARQQTIPDPLWRHAASETTGVETTSFLPRVSRQASTLHYGCSNLAIGWEPKFFLYHFIFLPFFTWQKFMEVVSPALYTLTMSLWKAKGEILLPFVAVSHARNVQVYIWSVKHKKRLGFLVLSIKSVSPFMRDAFYA